MSFLAYRCTCPFHIFSNLKSVCVILYDKLIYSSSEKRHRDCAHSKSAVIAPEQGRGFQRDKHRDRDALEIKGYGVV